MKAIKKYVAFTVFHLLAEPLKAQAKGLDLQPDLNLIMIQNFENQARKTQTTLRDSPSNLELL